MRGRRSRTSTRIEELEASLTEGSPPEGRFDGDLDGLPEPVARHLAASIAPGTPLARSVRLRMRGRIKIGRWVSFRASELLTPHERFVWAARAAGVIAGYDYYSDGRGGMDWRPCDGH